MVLACYYVSGLAQESAVAASPIGPSFVGKRVHWGPRVYEPDTKMSLLAQRKSPSVLFYSEESVVPMRTTLPLEPLGSMRTSLAPPIGSKDPADRLGSGASSTISSLMAASSLEATIAVACS